MVAGLFRPLTVASGLFALGLGGLALPAAAEPALFIASDMDTTVYLFSAVEDVPCNLPPPWQAPLPPGALVSRCAAWFTPNIEAAIRSADEIWLETPGAADATSNLLVAELGYFRGGSRLSQFLTSDEMAILVEEYARALRLTSGDGSITVSPVAATQILDILRPWNVMSIVVEAARGRSGRASFYGVDYEIERLAGILNKPVRGLERASDMVRILAGDPFDEQMSDLRTLITLLRHDIDPALVVGWLESKFWDVWLNGNIEGSAAVEVALHNVATALNTFGSELQIVLGLSQTEWTALDAAIEATVTYNTEQRAQRDYQRYIADRNHIWMVSIRGMLARPGTYFVAVGAGHFSGEAALQMLVAAEPGVTVRRVQ